DQYYLGISSTRLMQNSGSNTRYKLRRHYFLMGGYHHQLTPKYELTPSFMVKYDVSTIQVDVGAIVEYEKKYWGGVNYRVQDAVSVMVGLYLKDLKFGYAYDLSTSRLAGAGSGGSHELMLSYCFKIEVEKNNNSYRNIRFL
ncbi:MAG: PorP/SprF family type IX secretion system membrane protein, partial [Bacteroidota bacterium]|nr:PorP/SprF family type IX secretion system membrane protein [Bacteroidota bacterium]